MLYLCCTKLSFTTVNPLFIGYSVAIYDKPVIAEVFIQILSAYHLVNHTQKVHRLHSNTAIEILVYGFRGS